MEDRVFQFWRRTKQAAAFATTFVAGFASIKNPGRLYDPPCGRNLAMQNPNNKPRPDASVIEMVLERMGDSYALAKPRVLLVDDSAEQLLLYASVLESTGYETITANSGVEAIRVFASGSFDAVVLDYHMPDIDGGMLAGRMKERRPAQPVIMFSGMSLIPKHALSSVDRLVQKGESATALLDALASVLASGKGPREVAP